MVRAFPGRRVAVVGDVMLDAFVEGVADGICREAPVPRLRRRFERAVPGGAGNVAVNLAALGAQVRLVALTGADGAGSAVADALAREGVDASMLVTDERRRTLEIRRVCCEGHVVVRMDDGDRHPADRWVTARLVRAVRAACRDVDAIVVADYAAGVCTDALVDAVRAAGRGPQPPVVVVDAKQPERYAKIGATAMTPSWSEAQRLVPLASQPTGRGESGRPAVPGVPGDDARAREVERAAAELLRRAGCPVLAVTLDRSGAVVLEQGRPPHRTVPSSSVDRSAIGAGDAFTAAFTLALCAGADAAAAGELATRAARIAVHRGDTMACTAAELEREVGTHPKVAAGTAELVARLAPDRAAGRRVVLANGCFDLLHAGHLAYLADARALGDVLVVGVNSDASARAVKGPGRPINPVGDRVSVLAGLACVDHVVVFDEPTAVSLLEAVRPHVYAKGGDYTLARLPEAAVARRLGTDVRILPYVADRSTSSLIDRIRTGADGDLRDAR